MDLDDAALEARELRLRPILMTSFAFIFGCVPLWIASGAGAASRRILGTVVVSGMLAATLLAIFLIPMLFVLVERLATWRARSRAGVDHAVAEAERVMTLRQEPHSAQPCGMAAARLRLRRRPELPEAAADGPGRRSAAPALRPAASLADSTGGRCSRTRSCRR